MRDRLRALALRGVAWTLRGRRAISAKPADRLRVLLIRPDHLGDVLFLTPALAALRRAQPAAHITALVGPWAEPILRGNPDLDHVEVLAFPWFDRAGARDLVAPYVSLVRAAASLRGRFDIAIVLRFDHWWGGWLAAAAGIRRRIGYATPQLAPFLTEAVPYQPGRHEVLQNLTLTARLGTPGSTRPDEAPLRYFQSASAVAEAARWTSGSRPLVALHPGSGAGVKRWPPENWVTLAFGLKREQNARIVITGGAGSEAALAGEIVARAGGTVASAAGETSIEVLAALYAGCDLVIGPDTGPLHLAVAVGAPSIHLYGPVSPQLFGPWGDATRHRVLTRSLACQFCHRLDWPERVVPEHPCVHGLPAAWVTRAAREMLGAVKAQRN